MSKETDEEARTRRAAGSLRWFLFSAAGSSDAGDVTEAVLSDIRSLRSRFREAEGGGGMCHAVSEDLGRSRGWTPLSVGYLSLDGTVICAGHYVNVLRDGTLLDATADQFGEGHDIRVLRPGDAEYGRYRPEFYEDYHPGIEPVELAAWARDWNGDVDCDAQDIATDERGAAWWLDDPTPRLDFLRSQVALGASHSDSDLLSDRMETEIEAIEERLAGSAPCA